MQSKTFSADSPEAIIAAVNGWLTGETGITVRHTETIPADGAAGTPMRFCVWYDRDAP